MPPLVSIIIPCYNAEPYLREAILSALNQSHLHCEVVVVDDGSTDGSLEVVRSFGTQVRWSTGTNRGGCSARNLGLDMAKGKYIQFLDADDRISSHKIASQVDLLEATTTANAMAVCPWRYFDGDQLAELVSHNNLAAIQSGSDFLVQMWLCGIMFPPHAWLTPRSLIDQVGNWNEGLVADQDGEFFGRLLVAANLVIQSDAGEAHYRKPGDRNVSQQQSSEASRSRLEAWKHVALALKQSRDDHLTTQAIRRQLQNTAYGAMNFPEVVKPYFDMARTGPRMRFDVRPPRLFNLLCGLFGITVGFHITRFLKNPF